MSVQFVFAFKYVLTEIVKDIGNVMLGYSDVSLNITSKVFDFLCNYLKTEIFINDKHKRIDVFIIGDFDNHVGIVKVCM